MRDISLSDLGTSAQFQLTLFTFVPESLVQRESPLVEHLLCAECTGPGILIAASPGQFD